MQTVTFTKAYRHKIDALRTAHYPAGAELEVSNEVAAAAEKAGALKGKRNGRRSAPTDGKGDDLNAEG